MTAVEIVGGLAGLGAALLLAVAVRRRLLQRPGGTIDLAVRLRTTRGGGWALGTGRYQGEQLRFYPVFSLAPRPRRVLDRSDLSVHGRRGPVGGERHALLDGAVVLDCRTGAGPVQLAMGADAVTGFLAWLESRPPGATLPPS